MRKLKFRAWDKNKGEFVKNWDSVGEIYKKKENGIIEFLDCDIELLQFAGLVDKNGVEVFEGDVVKWQQASGGVLPADGNIYTCVIEWGFSHCWDCRCGESRFTLAPSHIEVIGNIYSNPELLK